MNIQELKNQRYQLQAEGNILKEVEILKKIAEETKNQFGYESNEYLQALNELGGTQKYIGMYNEAKENLNTACDIILKKFGENSLAYANNFLNLTEVLRYSGEIQNLENNYKKIVNIYKLNNATNTFDYAALCNNFGLFYQSIEKFDKAYNLHKTSLEILKKSLNNDTKLEYGVTLSNLYYPCLIKGNLEKAEEYLIEAIDIFKETVGETHPLYAASINNLAIYYYNRGLLTEALEFFEKSAEIAKKTMGSDSDNYKNILSNIELIKERLGILEDSKKKL